MKVLVTGSHGFIGTPVCQRLRDRGHTVTTVDWLEPRVHGNPANPRGLDHAIRAGKTPYAVLSETEAVVHLGAQVGVADSMTDPIRYVHDNTLDTTELLVSLRHAKELGSPLKRLVVASSMSVYGWASRPGITESDPVSPASVYGLTKYDQERLCLMFGELMAVPTIALRFFNVYGPGQALTNPYTGVLANFATWIMQDTRPVVYEDGAQTRDFIYVSDVVDAVIRSVETDVSGVMNIGTGKATTIRHAATLLASALRSPIQPQITYESRPGDIRHCTANVGLATECLDWQARVPFVDGISLYGQWLRHSRS